MPKSKLGLKLVHADITLKSSSGKSIHEKGTRINSKNIKEFFPSSESVEKVETILKSLGFRIIAKGKVTISIAAPIEEFQKIFGIKLSSKRFFPYVVPKSQKVSDNKGCALDFTYKEGKKLPIPKELEQLVEAIHIGTPALFCQSPNPPTPDYFHLKVPDDIARMVDSIQCHNHGINGTGVTLAMPDQGTFDHPYYTDRGYDITLDSSAYDDTADNGSHGTAIAANALAVAPGVHFIGIRNGKKISSGTAAFLQAVSHNPDVISISWGTTKDVPNLRAEIVAAIANGITICCACGNGGDVVFPSSIPEVISVGGTYADNRDRLEASTYASSGILAVADPGRQMPDLSGFVGQEPHGIYITLPCHSNSSEDQSFGGGIFPEGDETTDDDGWLVASGTSSATPQVAAVACLLIQSDPSFKGQPALIKQRLMETAIDVTTGTSASGQNATNGSDNATGTGVVDAFIAINRVDVWIRDNTDDRGLVPSKGAHWISPDIKVLPHALVNPDANFDAAIHISRPEYNKQYYVYIKARNRGVDNANNVTTGFYYADPSTFNSFPDDWNDGQSGNPANGKITVSGNPTNLITIASVPAKGSKVFGPYLWEPPLPTSATQVQDEPDGKKRGHFCMLTRIDCASDPVTLPGGAQSTVWNDNNIGMKNLWVVEPDLLFPLTLGKNIDGEKMKLIIDASKLPKDWEMWFQIPEKELDHLNLQSYSFPFAEKKIDRTHFVIEGGKRQIVKLNTKKRVQIYCIFKAPSKIRLRDIFSFLTRKKTRPVEISQYAGNQCIGGATFEVRPK